MNIRRFELPVILPDVKTVLGRLGYNPNKSQLEEALLNNIRSEIFGAGAAIHPVGHALEEPLKSANNGIVSTVSGLNFKSMKLCDLLQGVNTITLMVCTIGNQLKELSESLSASGQMTRAVILDAIASEAVEAFADYITEVLTREKGLLRLKPTMRFSPGYGDLKTDVHREMLPLLESDKIGIRFHPDNFILFPEKSISAVIGWKK